MEYTDRLLALSGYVGAVQHLSDAVTLSEQRVHRAPVVMRLCDEDRLRHRQLRVGPAADAVSLLAHRNHVPVLQHTSDLRAAKCVSVVARKRRKRSRCLRVTTF